MSIIFQSNFMLTVSRGILLKLIFKLKGIKAS